MGTFRNNSSDIFEQGGTTSPSSLTLPFSQTTASAGSCAFEIINTSTTNDSHAICGKNTGATGISAGVRGESNSASGYGVYGLATLGGGVGVQGVNQATGGTAVLGDANGLNGIGVLASGDGTAGGGTTGHRALVASLQNTSGAKGVDIDLTSTVTSSTGLNIDMGAGASQIGAMIKRGYVMVTNGSSDVTPVRAYHAHNQDSTGVHTAYTNSTTGSTASDGFIVGISDAEEAELVNFENTSMIFKTNNTTALELDNSQKLIAYKDLQVYGNSAGRYDKTSTTSCPITTANTIMRILDSAGNPITGMYNLTVYIMAYDATKTNVECWAYQWKWPNGGTERVEAIGLTASKGSTAGVPSTTTDGSGRKVLLTTGATALTCVCTVVGTAIN